MVNNGQKVNEKLSNYTPLMYAARYNRGKIAKLLIGHGAEMNNVVFKKGSVENLPFPDEAFDVVTSNGALYLVPDKARAFGEIYRVLKPGGRLMVADEILIGELPKEKDKIMESWAQ